MAPDPVILIQQRRPSILALAASAYPVTRIFLRRAILPDTNEQVLPPVVPQPVPQMHLAVGRDLPRLRIELVPASQATRTLLPRAMPGTMVKQDWTRAPLLT